MRNQAFAMPDKLSFRAASEGGLRQVCLSGARGKIWWSQAGSNR
jgi:hypothetical protein